MNDDEWREYIKEQDENINQLDQIYIWRQNQTTNNNSGERSKSETVFMNTESKYDRQPNILTTRP
jgi:hypothetical protein